MHEPSNRHITSSIRRTKKPEALKQSEEFKKGSRIMTMQAQLPPGPKQSAIKTAIDFGKDSWGFMEQCQKEFGDAFTLILPGQPPAVWVNNPEMVRSIFSLKAEQIDQSHMMMPVDIGEDNVLFQNDKPHQASRKMLIPPLNTNPLKNRACVMHEIITEHINSWKPGDHFNTPRLVGDITMDIICHTMFNLRSGEKKEQYKELMLGWMNAATSDTMFALGSLMGAKRFRRFLHRSYLKKVRTGKFGNGKKGIFPWKQSIELKAQLADMMRKDIREIREEGDTERTDLMSILARTTYEDGTLLGEEKVIAEGIGMLLGGHETSAATAAWHMIWLLRNPDAVKKVKQEVIESCRKEGKFDPLLVADLPLVSATLSESQRLTPSAGGTARILREDTAIGDLFIPAGTAVLPSMYLTHRRKDIYGEDALEYRPERWLDGKQYGPHQFFPFGGGRRACVGLNQAKQQLKILFAELARRVEFESELSNQTDLPIPTFLGGQTEPSNGVWVTVKSVKPESEGMDTAGNQAIDESALQSA